MSKKSAFNYALDLPGRSSFSFIQSTYTPAENLAIYIATKHNNQANKSTILRAHNQQSRYSLVKSLLRKAVKMVVTDTSDFSYQDFLDPSLLAGSDDLAAQVPSFDDICNFDFPEGDFAEAPQADANFDFDEFNFDQQAVQGVDSGSAIPSSPLTSFPDQRYVSSSSQLQTHPSSIWRPLEQPVQQSIYPDPELFSPNSIAPMPYYPLGPLPSSNTMTQLDLVTPAEQQFLSIDQPLFLHGNMGQYPATAGMLQYEPIQPYQDTGAFNPEDLALSGFPEDPTATALCEGWIVPDETFFPDTSNTSNEADTDADYKPSSSARPRRNRAGPPKAILPNGQVKKGRPCAKPQTEERRRINDRRMQGYYRRKYDQGNLEKARQQSKESYWKRKQKRIDAGENVRLYNPCKTGRVSKRT